MDQFGLRTEIYRHIVRTGSVPTRAALADMVGDGERVDVLLRSLHDAHMVVLDDRADRAGEIRMALPFAAEPTGFRVRSADGAWWANCAWDAFAVLAALHADGRIAATWSDTGEAVDIGIDAGRLDTADGYVQFAIPARHWWDDIVLT